MAGDNMIRRSSFGLALLAGLATGFGAIAQAPPALPAGDAAAGRQVALNVCAACHVVSRDQEQAPALRPPAPNFTEIANRPSLTTVSLRRFLATVHARLQNPSGMPNPQLTDQQIADVTAYVMSLRRPLRP